MTERPSNSRSSAMFKSKTDQETPKGSSMKLLWSHEKLVKAACIALQQHIQSDKVSSSGFSNHQNLYWSNRENNINNTLKTENDDHNHPSSDEYIHLIPSDKKKAQKSTPNDVHTNTNVQILDNDIMHLGSIAAYTALLFSREKKHNDDDENERKQRKRRKIESVLTSSLHLESPSSRLQNNSQSSISSTQAVCKTNNDNISAAAKFSQLSHVNSEVLNATTTTSQSNDVMAEWDRMLDERPNTSDIVGVTQWLLKLYALAAAAPPPPQSSKSAVTTLPSPSA